MENKARNKRIFRYFKDYALLVFGCFLVAFGAAAFLTPCNIVAGGVTSIGIILNQFLEPLLGFDTNSLVSTIAQVILLIIGWIVLGKSFGFRTAVASIIFIGFYALLMEFKIGELMGLGDIFIKATGSDISESAGVLVLMGLAGGALQGVGVAITYLAGGSTGGTDILARIFAKFTRLKDSATMFIVDAILIIIGIIVYRNVLLGIVGILTSFIMSTAIQMLYITLSSFLVVDIISDKYKEIQEYVHTKMENNGHASTIIHSQGGYSGVEKEMLRVVIYIKEESKFRAAIYAIDPNAFIVISQAKSIHGDGFQPLIEKVATNLKKVTKLPKKEESENIDNK